MVEQNPPSLPLHVFLCNHKLIRGSKEKLRILKSLTGELSLKSKELTSHSELKVPGREKAVFEVSKVRKHWLNRELASEAHVTTVQ